MGYIMNRENKLAIKAADYPNAADTFHTLMESLDDLINRCDESDEQKTIVKKDIYTDIVIPGLKRLYQDCTDYVLWGSTRSIRCSSRLGGYGGIAVERDYTDEEEDSEDE